MPPETEKRPFDLTAAEDLLGNIGDVAGRALKYSPRLVKHALIGIVIGAVIGTLLLGHALLSEQTIASNPQIYQQYPQLHDLKGGSGGNRFAIDNPWQFIAGFAFLGGGIGGAAPWIKRKLEEFCLESERPK